MRYVEREAMGIMLYDEWSRCRHVTTIHESVPYLESVLIDWKTHLLEKSFGWAPTHRRLPLHET